MNRDNTASSLSTSNQGNYQDKVWTFAKDFSDDATGICIRVNVCESPSKFPGGEPSKQYSWELVRMKQQNTRVSRFFPILMQNRNGRVMLDEEPKLNVLADLITSAKQWAASEKQEREDKIMEARIKREEADANKGQQQQRPGLKQLSKMDHEKKNSGR